jgi:hypothetical protein
MSQENAGPCWMMSGRRGHPAGRALRSGSGRSRPRRQVVRSPTQALRRGPAGPRLLPTAHRRAGGRTPPDPRPRRRGRAAGDPGLIAPYPTPGPVPARTGRGRRQAVPCAPAPAARQAGAGHPVGHAHHPPPRRTDRSSAQECGSALGTWCPGVGQLVDLYPSRLARRLGTAASTHGTLPHHRAMPHPRCIAVLGVTISGRA